MKTVLSLLCAILAGTLTVSASPLSIETKVTEDGTTVIHPTLSAKSGQEISVRYGDVECVFKPILRKDRSLEIDAHVRQYNGESVGEICRPRVTAKLGQRVTIDYGNLAFEYTTLLAK